MFVCLFLFIVALSFPLPCFCPETVREGGDKSAKYFMIVTPARTFSLKADSESEMQRWVAGLLEALRRMGKVGESPYSSLAMFTVLLPLGCSLPRWPYSIALDEPLTVAQEPMQASPRSSMSPSPSPRRDVPPPISSSVGPSRESHLY
jgi:hypothetical protein